MALTIKPLTHDTLDVLASLVVAFYDEDPSATTMSFARARLQAEAMLRRPERVAAMLIMEEDQIAGYALLVPYFCNEYGGEVLVVDELYVKPEFRSQGLGSTFLEYLKVWALEQGSVRLILEVMPENTRALQFYQRAGFTSDGRHVLTYALRDPEPFTGES
ncbi:MAG: N-acetyltransferase family protein [Myxococcota bacterium]